MIFVEWEQVSLAKARFYEIGLRCCMWIRSKENFAQQESVRKPPNDESRIFADTKASREELFLQ